MTLAEKNLALGYHMVRKRGRQDFDQDDEIQEAYLALRHAESRYDPRLGTFGSYAARWIRQRLALHGHEMYYPLKMPAPGRADEIRAAVHLSIDAPVGDGTDTLGSILPAPAGADPTLRPLVEELLAVIDPVDRKILELYYLQDRPADEICSILNLSKSRIHFRRQRALTRIRLFCGQE